MLLCYSNNMDEIKTIKIEEDNYLAILRKISNPPKILYYIGDFKKEELCLGGFIGTRKHSPYGKQENNSYIGYRARRKMSLSAN